jgi:excisionase family DNA binding protein
MTGALLLTKAEAAALLNVSTRHLTRLVAEGDIPALRIGRRLLRFTPAALHDYVVSFENASQVAAWPQRNRQSRRGSR